MTQTLPIAQAVSRAKPAIGGDGDIRLNLGGIGDNGFSEKLKGFLTVDIQDVPDTDIVADCSDLKMFNDETVSEIYASNILEHWPHTKTVSVLKEWYRVLKKGRILWISVPDMDANFRIYQKYGLVPWVQYLIWGDQYHPYAFHYINFTFASLAKAVTDAGFSDIKRVTMMPFKLRDASAHLDSFDKKPVSLNVKCTK